MPEFSPGELKTVVAPIIVSPSGLSCEAEVFLGPDESTKVVTSGWIPFTSTGYSQDVRLPIAMPVTEGTYHVFIDVYAEGVLIGAYQATEDVLIAPLGPTIINGDRPGASPWVFDTNYWGRSGGGVECSLDELDKYELLPIEGICVAEMHASVGGRRINMTFTESIPWRNSYRGLPISVSVRAISERYQRKYGVSFYSGTIMRVEIDDGVSVSSSPSIDSGIGAWQRITANKIIAPNATKLDIILRCLPYSGFPSGFNAFFDNVRME